MEEPIHSWNGSSIIEGYQCLNSSYSLVKDKQSLILIENFLRLLQEKAYLLTNKNYCEKLGGGYIPEDQYNQIFCRNQKLEGSQINNKAPQKFS